MMPRHITPEEIERLREVYPRYQTVAELQAAFPGRVVNTIIGAARRLKIKRTIRCKPSVHPTQADREFPKAPANGDRLHVKACLKAGGFRYAVKLRGRWFTIVPDEARSV
jgi:hypothetical protein